MAGLSKTLGVASVAALIAFGGGAALAQSPPAKSGQEMSAAGKEARPGKGWRAARFLRIFDTDGNGNVSLAEIQAEQKRIAGAADVNGDGVLSVDEFRRRGRLIRSLRGHQPVRHARYRRRHGGYPSGNRSAVGALVQALRRQRRWRGRGRRIA